MVAGGVGAHISTTIVLGREDISDAVLRKLPRQGDKLIVFRTFAVN